MDKVWIGTNWKMTKTLSEGLDYCDDLINIAEDLDSRIELFIIPPYTSLLPIKEKVQNTKLHLGAQNMHWEESGAYTGEISPLMLDEIKIGIVELGHSERRQYFNENDEDINKKVHSALKFVMKPLICIGENLQQKNNQVSLETLSAQLKVCLKGLSNEQAAHVSIAYEPVWAIGESGIPSEPNYVSYIHNHLRRVLCELFDSNGDQIPILYGGSVNKSNSLDYLELNEVNGLFIGRSAWNIETFEEILLDANAMISKK